MANQFEWAHVADFERWIVNPEDIAELSDDGNPNGDYGLSFSTGSNGCLIFGSLDELDQLADRIKQMVSEARS